jgi:hypothetical protein
MSGLTQEDTISVPRKVSIFLVIEGDFAEDEKVLLKESLLIKLAEDNDISLVEPLVLSEPGIEERHTRAEELGADCWLAVKVSADTEAITIVYSSYDLIDSQFTIEEKSYRKSRKIRSLHRSFWKDIIIDMAKAYSQITGKLEIKEVIEYTTDTKDAIQQKGVKVVIAATPGTRITGLTKEPLIVNTMGIAKTELAQLTTYKLKALCPGYYPLKKSFYIEYDPVRITLEQVPGSRFAFDVYLHQVDYLGLGALFYILPNFLYVELSATTFYKKLIWPVDKESDPADFESPLLPVYLTAGYYINREDALFRFGFNTGAFVRFVSLEDTGITLDPISTWGIKILGFHGEFSGFRKIRFYYEHNVLAYYTETPALMQAAIQGPSGSGGTAGYIFGLDPFVFDVLDLKIGVRIIL